MTARYEFKYRLSTGQAERVREWADLTLDRDPNGARGRYHVNSLYFDTPQWQDARASEEGQNHRSKLRLRTYGRKRASCFFLERKIKTGSAVQKRRVRAGGALARTWKGAGDPLLELERSADPRELDDIRAIRSLVETRQMTPKLWVRYERRAWISPFGDQTRLTLDRNVEASSPSLTDSALYAGDWHYADPDPRTILELKFTRTCPEWMHDLVTSLSARREACSKYGIAAQSARRWAW